MESTARITAPLDPSVKTRGLAEHLKLHYPHVPNGLQLQEWELHPYLISAMLPSVCTSTR